MDDRTKWLVGGAVLGGGLWWLTRRRTSAEHVTATSFEAYMRSKDVAAGGTQQQKYVPTDFSSYLKQAGGRAGGASPASAPLQQAAAEEEAPLDSKPVLILYGTEFGFSKEVAEKAAEQLKGAGYWPRLADMADHPSGLASLGQQQALLVVCSTQGDGVPPTEARDFCDWLASGSAPQLSGLPFSVCALGDRSYQHFCRCGRSLDERLEALGASRLAARVDVNKEDWKAIDGWVEGVLSGLAALDLRTVAELGGTAALAAEGSGGGSGARRWSRARPYMGTVVALEGLCTLASADDKNTWRVEVDLGDSGLEYQPGDALGVWPTNCPEAVEELLSVMGADGGLLVRLPSWHYANPALEGSDTISLRQALLSCYDLRQPKLELLQLLLHKLQLALKQQQQQQQPQQQAAATANGGGAAAPNGLSGSGLPGKGSRAQQRGANGSAAHGSTNSTANGKANGKANGHLPAAPASNGGGKVETIHAVANGTSAVAPAPPHTAHADALCAGGCIVDKLEQLAALCADSTAAEKYLEPRHVVDVLEDFRPAALGVGELLGCLRQLAPRLYSISSSQREHPTRVQATVAVVRYDSLKRRRLGVASTYLCERLAPGQRLPVYISKNPDFRLPADPATPIIMVGPGTGLAPFRAFMQERILASQAAGGQPFGTCLLYFGCRRRDQDFLYGPLLEGWAAEGLLTLRTAFSREQAQKVYVQQRLAEDSDLVWQLLQAGAHFYVCGDASSMAGQVEEALLGIIEAHQGQGRQGAQAYLDALSAQQRYQRDVWF